jgi:hypothetical protein
LSLIFGFTLNALKASGVPAGLNFKIEVITKCYGSDGFLVADGIKSQLAISQNNSGAFVTSSTIPQKGADIT